MKSNPEIPTPRTDSRINGGCIATDIVEHARTLERQLTRAMRIIDELRSNGWARAYVNYKPWDAAVLAHNELKKEQE